ncbi:uncharacterized protein PV06_10041 [Exophiala oligosperma]|uniref:G-patch domain-containing protein n=1 Tax=Exophiala oligosperma TaxID=215243 RepID=A0A0D2BL48_9EURO|nr:uncharacterized protein PV06_10041 [Exophiala oligosperma]KIW38072.1 hypothetical protein PV06_10041 [Exophiala oligosperma]
MAYKRSRQAYEADLHHKSASSFVLYGTPLPPLDEHTRDDGSFVPVWKQEVTDDRGRKRLHGAFTGGFSAGYFNTVGSKEGWTPSTFVSSRQNRKKDGAKPTQQRPEDFMDEEDLREAEEARTINTSSEFAGFGTEHDPLRRSAAIDIFRPSQETIGSTLLKRMGWREGQGIGSRVRRKAKFEEEDEDTSSETHLFAPDDVQIVSLARKTDYKGLGYEGELQDKSTLASKTSEPTRKPLHREESSDDETSSPSLLFSKMPSGRAKKTGIGVGILNDDGSDDEDPFSMGPKISYNRTLGVDKKPKSKAKNSAGSANPLVKTKPTFISKKLANLKGALRQCHDGRLPPDGFVLASHLDSFSSLTVQDDKYKPPEVPTGWTSSRSIAPGGQNSSDFVSTADAARLSSLTAKGRASILGEAQLPGKSVFDFLTSSARDRLAAASGHSNLPAAGNEPPPPGFQASQLVSSSLQSLVPELDKATALQALHRGTSGWMPYAEDEKKRSRYRAFLEIQAGLRQDELPPRAKAMKQDDWVIEMQEFARAAEVFKPVSGLMASRFTTSTASLQGQNPDSSAPMDAMLTRPTPKQENPATSAARMGMFGPMTRSVSNFYPTRLLCKRFNVPCPDHSATSAAGTHHVSAATTAQREASTTQFRSFTSSMPKENADSTSPAPADSADAAILRHTGSVEEANTPNPEMNEALEKEKPGQAVFKAIFGSEDEADDEM